MKTETRTWSFLGLTCFTSIKRENDALACAAIASPGDVVVLRLKAEMNDEAHAKFKNSYEEWATRAGIKVMVLQPGLEFVQLLKFKDKPGDGEGKPGEPLPFFEEEANDRAGNLG